MNSPFLWGAGGQKITPEQRRASVAQALAGIQPMDNPMQGVAMMAQAGVDRLNDARGEYPRAPGPFGGLYELGARLTGNRFGGGLY